MSRKAQAWYMDFAIGLLLFFFTIVIYMSYTDNLQNQDKGELDDMLTDARAISSSLILSGYPTDWNNKTVIRIGIADDQRINATKLKLFKSLNYTMTKKIFPTPYDYFVFFMNDKGQVLNIYGICGVGNFLVNITYDIKSAYYYQDPADSILKDFMNQTFKADIYFNDISNFASNLSKYGFIVMEHPLLSGSQFASYRGRLENFSSNGGIFMISGELAAPQASTMVGVDFRKKSGQSSTQRRAIVNNTDPYLALTVGQSMVFDQYYYVINNSDATQFNIIATFNQSDDNAIAKWKYGNGSVYFFSDFNVTFFSGDFIKIIEDLAKSFIEGTCTPINVTNLKQKRLVKIERYVNYNSKIVKMVVYLWQ